MGDSSRRVHYSQKRTRRPKGGKDVYGEREDQSAFVRCGYCGFINKISRTESGGPTSLSGVIATAYEIESSSLSEVVASFYLTLDCGGLADYPVGTQSVLFYKPVVHRYCAFCGSPNWNK